MSNSEIADVLASRARRAAAPARRPSSSPRAKVGVRPAQARPAGPKPARKPARTDSAKGVADEWQIVVTVEETTPGDARDILLRREQAHALYGLAREHGARDGRFDRA